MVTVNNSDYYNNIPAGRDLNKLPNNSSAGTTVGYQYDGLTEEDRFVQKVLQEHYDKVYKENLSHSDPMAYIESKYCDVTSPNFCSYMTEDQRSIAYRNEKRMLQTGGKYSAGFARYDYALRNYKDVYTGGSRSVGYVRNTDREKQHARSVVNQQISNLLSKNGISISKQADLVFSIDPYTYQLTVSGNADRDTLSQIEKLLNEGDNAKNIWTHAWICMHDADNEIVNSQANMTKANQYSLWHEVYETTGYDARNATYKNGTFIAEDGTDLLALFKEKYYSDDHSDWTYYNSDYYYQCNDTNAALRESARKMTEKWELDGIDCDEIEANSSLTLDGGFDFNSIWNSDFRNQAGRSSLAKESTIPPENFKMFFKEQVTSFTEDNKFNGNLKITIGENKFDLKVPFQTLRTGSEGEICNVWDLMEDYYSESGDNSNIKNFLGNMSVFTRWYAYETRINDIFGDYEVSHN